MKSFLKFIGIFGGILALSAFLAPHLFDILPYKFERIFNRLVMIFSLIAIVLFVRVRKNVLESYGIFWKKESPALLLKGFAAGFLILLVVVLLRFLFGNAVWNGNLTLSKLGMAILKNLPAALLIGVIEEFFFRGFLYRVFKDKMAWPLTASLIATNLIYAFIHFLSVKKPFVGPDPVYFDSLRLMAAPFASITAWPTIWPAAVGLFLFGWALSDVSIRSRSLYPAIGVHAGCVFFIKMDSLFVDFLPGNLFFWGSDKIYNGMLGWCCLGLLILGLRKWVATKTESGIKT